MTFFLPNLTYKYDKLEPHIDALTMKIHHTLHHQGYINKANDALKATPWEAMKAKDILKNITHIDLTKRQAIINNVGGHANHSLFWQTICPNGGGEPKGTLKTAIQNKWKTYEKFQEEFTLKASSHFGSGWVWLCKDHRGELHLISTPNQDSPYMQNLIPLMGLDIWEHAYYLKYQNRRPEYIKAFWNIVYWNNIESRFNNQ